MKSELIYCDSTSVRKLINLCSEKAVNLPGAKVKFLLLPDKQMSFVKILELPSAPKSKLRNIIGFQINKIYPGRSEDISFDFIPFKTSTGWKIVLYILMNKFINEILIEGRFERIVLPLQLLSKKEMQGLSCLVIYYPDMVEVWNFKNEIPDKVKRYNRKEFSVEKSLTVKTDTTDPKKIISIFTFSEKFDLKLENINVKTKLFSGSISSVARDEIYFLEYKVIKRDTITPVITVTAFLLSLVLLTMTALNNSELNSEAAIVNIQNEDILRETSLNQEKLLVIAQLDKDLKQIYESVPVNVYKLLLRAGRSIDSNTVILSFSFNENELTLTLQNQNALNNLEGIKNEFGNVKASNIRTLADGSKKYTVRVEIEQ